MRLDVDGTASVTAEYASGVAIQPDGKIVVAGTLRVSGGPSNVLVYRLNANGTPDATFGVGGLKLGTPPAGPDYHSFEGTAVALQSDGSIIVAGSDDWDGTDTIAPHPFLMRFLPTTAIPLHASGGAAPSSSRTAAPTLSKEQPLLSGATVFGLGSLDFRLTDVPDATGGMASGDTHHPGTRRPARAYHDPAPQCGASRPRRSAGGGTVERFRPAQRSPSTLASR